MATTTATAARGTASRMTEAAQAFLEALDASQRATALVKFDDPERWNWHYTPPRDHGGITFAAMDAPQQQLAHRLIATGLSLRGYAKATAIIAIEHVLHASEGGRGAFRRDVSLYHVTIFGTPGSSEPWGWRFQGHHISLNCVIVDGTLVAPLPTFFGSNPAELGDHRPLAAETDGARELLASLDAEQRSRAVISPAAPADMMTANLRSIVDGEIPPTPWELLGAPRTDAAVQELERRRAGLGLTDAHDAALRYTSAPKGLAASEMSNGQREHLIALARTYVERMPDELAAYEWGRIEASGIGGIHFAWAGSDAIGEPHYYRLQGASFLVEFDNTQNDANHIHSVWRDPTTDFGADLLARHYSESH